jgi:23S rRNA (uridine2552-2'-O)-methyltransferase
MGRSKSSQRWLKEHFEDEYVQRAQQMGYRSRAVFKLLEVQERDRLLRPGMVVVDLGAAPGGWSQLAADLVGRTGKVVGLDILPMDPLPGVEFIHGDFRDESVLAQLLESLEGRPVDLVLCDMAPNISGMKTVDQPRSMYLAELAADLCRQVLREGGSFLAKVFQGTGSDSFIKELRQNFDSVVVRKPDASRARSREVYVLARNYHV